MDLDPCLNASGGQGFPSEIGGGGLVKHKKYHFEALGGVSKKILHREPFTRYKILDIYISEPTLERNHMYVRIVA